MALCMAKGLQVEDVTSPWHPGEQGRKVGVVCITSVPYLMPNVCAPNLTMLTYSPFVEPENRNDMHEKEIVTVI